MANPLVLVLGAGINGTAVARELVLDGLDVVLVDVDDVAGGTSTKSSRLIHGGLRYLEYGEFSLVRESLAERNRLLKLAPQYVTPLQLFIPVRQRFGGLARSAWRFLGLESWATRWGLAGGKTRGLYLVRLGLTFYDLYAQDRGLPRHATHRLGDSGVPDFDPESYRFACSYWDAQIACPERFQLAMLEDARRVAQRNGTRLEVHSYTRATRDGEQVVLTRDDGTVVDRIKPEILINATGAWGDRTLQALQLDTKRLFAGTRGSHFITYHAGLRDALGGQAVYAEAQDGRLVFLLPLGGGVMVGTTDDPYDGDPHKAIATDAELAYLRNLVAELFPNVRLQSTDIALHYCGVRPLPYVSATSPSAVTRRHWIDTCDTGPFPILTLVGGKLTVCRSLAEDTAKAVAQRLGRTKTGDTRDRPIPGAEDFPQENAARRAFCRRIADLKGVAPEMVDELCTLYGTRVGEVLDAVLPLKGEVLHGTHLPIEVVRWIVRQEWVDRLADLVERRLLLAYRPTLSANAIDQLARILVEEGHLPADRRETTVASEIDRLGRMLGRVVQ